MKKPALIISPHSQWGLTTARLYHIDISGAMVDIHGVVTDDKQYDELSSLLSLVNKVQPLSFYDLVDKKMFRTPSAFWDKADNKIQQYVKNVGDKRLAKVIRKASELDIPIFYREDKKDVIWARQQLSLSSDVPRPSMKFRRTDIWQRAGEHDSGTGIEYSLTLKIHDNIIVPSQHHVNIITAKPGIISIDNSIYFLDESFSGRLLMPFREKTTVNIPKRMERDYFHKFILHNVATADVEAEGFDLTDIHPQRYCRLSRVTDITGRNSITIEYVYGTKSFMPSDKASSHVTLEETDNGFRFLRILRDSKWEQSCHECLESYITQAKGVILYNNVIRFDSLTVMIDWMREHYPSLSAKGFEIEQPSDDTYYIGAMDLHEDMKQSGDWLLLSSHIVLEDDRTIPFLALRDTILAGEKEYTMSDGTRLIIPDVWLKKYTPLMISGTEEGSALRVHRTLFEKSSDNIQTDNHCLDEQSSVPSIAQERQQEYPIPSSLKATLRTYQEIGYQWLANHLAHQRGCCLSDEMGLGKTVQTIALLLHYKEISKRQQPKAFGMLFSEEEMRGESESHDDGIISQYVSLIVAPTSLVHNWKNELQRFAPSLSAVAYHGTPEERRRKLLSLSERDIVITTYRTLLNDIHQLSALQYGIIVFDESQAFKNHDSQIHKSVTLLKGLCRIALSGTPVENGIQELWSLFHVIQSDLLGSYSTFNKQYLSAVAANINDIRTETLRRIISPYMLKRTKDSVLTDLPERQDELVICPMSQEQEDIYVSELSQARNSVMDDESHQSVHVLTAIQRLRQIACHPALVSSGAQQLTSGKMDEVFMRLESIHGTEHKVLLFSEYVGFLTLISQEMSTRKWKHAVLTGETQHREQIITDFQDDDSCQFFLISLKAGGVGLNLTQADYVFILDPWWNIAAEEQAISRAHRIGQRNAVFVYRFISEKTLEEQVLTLQNDKQAIIDNVLFTNSE